MFGRLRWLLPVKDFFFVSLETLRCLNKYFFRKRKCNDILVK